MPGAVVQVLLKRQKGEGTVPVDALELVQEKGILGDLHFDEGGKSRGQLLLLDVNGVAEERWQPGTLREQIAVDFPSLQSLEPGTLLRVGGAVVEITMDCTPCLTMASYVGEDGKAFVKRMIGRRGMLARVKESGTVRPGDPVEVCK
ncbi:MAG: hypothetical protein C4341_05570 [Armatimonadota bacterium]